MRLSLIDHYLLSRTIRPTLAVVSCAVIAFLMERILRSSYLLSQTRGGIDFLSQLTLNLAPHYLALTLPGGFFIGLFMVVSSLSKESEIDALLANGMSLGRVAAPLVGLGLVLMTISLLLFGFLQPLTWYAYHGVLNAAANAGWTGELRQQAVVSLGPDLALTADDSDRTGRRLTRVFIRLADPARGEEVVTADSGVMRRVKGARSMVLDLTNGQDIITRADGSTYSVRFRSLSFTLPIAPNEKAFRARGDEVTELTLSELVRQGLYREPTIFRRQAVLAELYVRLARAIALPFMPLLALPLGLTAKRSGSAPAFAFAGVLLFTFESLLLFGHGLANAGQLSAALAEGGPTAAFAGICIWTFVVSRTRPGENPVSWLSDHVAELIERFRPRRARLDGEMAQGGVSRV